MMNTEKNILESFPEPDLKGFKPVSYLEKALKNNNISEIRSALMIILNDRDLSIHEVLCSIYYVWYNNQSVFEESKKSAFIDPINNNENIWNKDYYFRQQTFLNRNFTLERMLHLLNIRETLIKNGHPDFQPRKKSFKTQTQFNKNSIFDKKEQSHQQEQHHDFIKKSLIIGGATLAAILALFFIIK